MEPRFKAAKFYDNWSRLPSIQREFAEIFSAVLFFRRQHVPLGDVGPVSRVGANEATE